MYVSTCATFPYSSLTNLHPLAVQYVYIRDLVSNDLFYYQYRVFNRLLIYLHVCSMSHLPCCQVVELV